MNTQVRRLVTKIAKLRYAAKSAYCDEVLSFLEILKDRDVSDQIVNIPEDKAQRQARQLGQSRGGLQRAIQDSTKGGLQ